MWSRGSKLLISGVVQPSGACGRLAIKYKASSFENKAKSNLPIARELSVVLWLSEADWPCTGWCMYGQSELDSQGISNAQTASMNREDDVSEAANSYTFGVKARGRSPVAATAGVARTSC